jgi:hypothetical protein
MFPFAFLNWHRCCSEIFVLAMAILFLIGISMEFCAVLAAPLGYQDDRGFHVETERR